VVDIDPGGLVGMIALFCAPHPITGEPYADELCWWVEPAYRRGNLGLKLLRCAERWATTKGATMLKMVAPEGTDIGRFYERVGYRAVETAYQKRL
jgi:GNAT superfamily N-acetyltransferase